MSGDVPAVTPVPATPEWLRIERIVRGDDARGVGVGTWCGGQVVVVRWLVNSVSTAKQSNSAASPEVEYSALCSIPSNGTPQPIDLFVHGDRTFSVTSRIAGRNVTWHRHTNVDALAQQLWDIIAITHESGWVHCDIRPENIIVDRTGSAYLVDWESAATIGAQCGPGTLGYSPHWAWSGSNVADPVSDYYSLAIVIWELWNGRSAFGGVRESVVQSQSTFDFACERLPPPAIRALFDAAQDRRVPRGRPDVTRPNKQLAFDARRGVKALVRRQLGTAASTAIADVSNGGLLVVSVRDKRSGEEPLVAGAVTDELRARWSRSCITLDAAVAYQRRRLGIDVAPLASSQSRADGMRATRLRRTALAVAVGEMALSTVIACADGSPLLRDILSEISVRQRAPKSTGDEPRSPTVATCRFYFSDDVRRDLLLQTAKSALPSSAIVQSTMLAIGKRETVGLNEIVDVVGGAFGQRTRSRRRNRPSRRMGRESTTGAARRVHRESRAPVPSASSADQALDAGERAAAAGRVELVFRSCVRAHTALLCGEALSSALVVRLADLWVECARGDAAESALRTIEDTERHPEVVVRLGRVLSSRGDIEGLRSLVAQAVGTADDRELRPELERLQAVIALHDGDKRVALRRALSALNRSRGGSESTAIWAAMTTGNVLRMLGRSWSARRILSLARRRAIAVGSIRLSVIAAANLLQVPRIGQAPGQTAHEAANLATECRKLGMMAESATITASAAAWAIIAHEPKSAARMIETLWSNSSCSAYATPTVSRMLRRRWRDAVDLSESWAQIERIAIGDVDRADSGANLHRALLRMELGIENWDGSSGVMRDGIAGDCGPVWRVLVELVGADCDSPDYVQTLESLAPVIAAESPIVGHVARAMVRAAVVQGRTERLLERVTSASARDATVQRLVEAVQILAVCYGPPTAAAALRGLAVRQCVQEWARPAGVRLWEWQTWLSQLAHVGAIDAADGVTVDRAIALAEDALADLGTDCRRSYCLRLPYDTWKRCAGLGDVELPDLEQRDAAIAPVTAFRAWLGRNGATSAREHARMVGLERVVQYALRLRATADVDTVLRQVALGVLEVVRAERAVVIYDQATGPGLAVVATGSEVNYEQVSAAEVSSSAIERVRATGRACIVDDACGDDELASRPSVRQYRARSLVVAPLRVRGRTLGHLYVENRTTPRSFSASDAEIIEGFAAQAALALENSQLVNELRATCDTLREARNDAIREESLRVVGRVAAEVAHDLNNLLTAILGESQLLLQGQLGSEIRQSLEVIQKAVLDGNTIVARIQRSTKAPIRRIPEGVQVDALVRDVAEAVRRSAEARGVAVVAPAGSRQLRVRGVAAELREVLTNVVMNAVDASDSGGVVRIAVDAAVDRVEIRVEDRGCGMSPATVARAFDPFFTTKGSGGNGLGLSIAKGIVERHGGGIEIASAINRGTTVAVVLPIVSIELDGAEVGSLGCVSETALVVSDDVTVARALMVSLGSLGIHVESMTFREVDSQRILAEKPPVRAVFVDLGDPTADRVRVAHAAAESLGPRKVVVMSCAAADVSTRSLAQELGVHVLLSPASRAELARALGV